MDYRMKEVIKRTGLTEKAIRHYIEKGLIHPEEKEQNGRINYYFDEKVIQELTYISLLRYYNFSVQEIGIIFDGDVGQIQNVLKAYISRMEKKQDMCFLWKKETFDVSQIKNTEQLISILKKNKEVIWKEKVFSADFARMDEETEEVADNWLKKRRKYGIQVLGVCFILLIGFICGIFCGNQRAIRMQERTEVVASFQYGLVESKIMVTEVEWKEFPGWRNMSCRIQGEFSVNLPKGADITFYDMQNADSLTEISREHQVISDGKELLYYDNVTYQVIDGAIEAIGILKNTDNEIVEALSGYKVGITWGEGEECFLGYIPPQSRNFEAWTELHNKYSKQKLTQYLDAFMLSRTYADVNVLNSITVADDVELVKMEGGLLDCIIVNNGTSDWVYSFDLPSLEMWYGGVWIEVRTKWDSALITDCCPKMQKKEIIVPESITDEYPTLFPGIYRLVVYGVENDCVVSETFVIDGKDTTSITTH